LHVILRSKHRGVIIDAEITYLLGGRRDFLTTEVHRGAQRVSFVYLCEVLCVPLWLKRRVQTVGWRHPRTSWSAWTAASRRARNSRRNSTTKGDTSDSASMNVWFHKEVIMRIAANGGKVPAELLD
jgi:hypothetical protein